MKRRALCGVSMLALIVISSSAATGANAQAVEVSPKPQLTTVQDNAPSAGSVMQGDDSNAQDIIVTAQRRSERLQEVPISITAVGSEQLATRNVTDLSSLRAVVPGLTISQFAGFNASNLVAIRGVAGQPLPIGAGQATAIYLDGVYLSRPDAAFFSLDDVERIEVLRGPQGTLYGRNATAGAINIITREPGDKVEGGFDVSGGRFDRVLAKSSLSGPLGAGFSAGVSASYDRQNGYLTNIVTGNDLSDRDAYTVRAKLQYRSPGGAFKAGISADTSRTNSTPAFKNQYSVITPGSSFVGLGNPNEVALDQISEQLTISRVRSKGLGATLSYEVGNGLQLVSVTGLRDVKTFNIYDLDGSPVPLLLSIGDNSSKSFNQELRAVFTGHRVRATVGGNYYREHAGFNFNSVAPTLAVQSVPRNVDDTVLNAYAAFAQIEFDFTDRLTLVGGLRYNYEDRDFSLDFRALPPVGGVSGLFLPGKITDSVVLPSAGINFKMTPDVLLYAKVSEGYQAPGFNVSPAFPGSVNTFGAETLWAYEVGIKSQFWDRRITLNAAAFYYEYSNIQVRRTQQTGVVTIDNAADATIKGVEASLSVRTSNRLTLSAQGTYLRAVYGNYCSDVSLGTPLFNDTAYRDAACTLAGVATSPAITFADRSGNALNLAPKWSGSVAADYVLPLSSLGDLRAHVDYSWESNVFYSSSNEPALSSGGWSKLDGRIGLRVIGGAEFYVFGKNLTDKRYYGYALRATPTLAPSILNEPRTYGAGLRYRF